MHVASILQVQVLAFVETICIIYGTFFGSFPVLLHVEDFGLLEYDAMSLVVPYISNECIVFILFGQVVHEGHLTCEDEGNTFL
jgi:hypothetical protein